VELVAHVLRALDEGRAEWPLSLVTELYIFGSLARGAIEPHDVDIDIEFQIDWRWAEHFAGCLAYGRNPHSPIKRALTGGRRGCQFEFNYRDRADFEMVLFWRKDGTLPAALERLRPIRPDPAAGRAARDAMLRSSRESTSGYRARSVKRYPKRSAAGPSPSSGAFSPTDR